MSTRTTRARRGAPDAEATSDSSRPAKQQRSMRQKETKRSPLDALAGKGKAVPGAPDLSYSLGGVAEVGGAEVERVLDSVEMDDQVAAMRGPYAGEKKAKSCLMSARRAVPVYHSGRKAASRNSRGRCGGPPPCPERHRSQSGDAVV